MNFTEAYRLSEYQVYGTLGNKENIYLARNKKNGKICVKKQLDKSQKEIVEFRKTSHSPYFPKLEEVVECEGKYIIIEEYIEGITLEELMMEEPLEKALAEEFAGQICEALKALHNHTPMIVYRDLKPENIMVTSENQIKLIDFDISRCHQEGKPRDTLLLGTAEYAAPEQFGYFQTDNRTDIYAFGIVLNYMLTAKFPVEYVTEGKFEKIVRKCIELEPSKRYQKIEEIVNELPKNHFVNQKWKNAQNNEKSKKSWAIPGFRSRRLWKMLIALLGYGTILGLGLTMEFSEEGIPYTSVREWLNRGAFTISQLAAIFTAFNYRGISKNVKIFSHRYKILRVAGYFITSFLFFCIAAFVTVVIEMVFQL